MWLNSVSLCNNGLTDQDPVWGEHSWGPWNIVLDGGPDLPTAREGGFSATFAKLLWPLVLMLTV